MSNHPAEIELGNVHLANSLSVETRQSSGRRIVGIVCVDQTGLNIVEDNFNPTVKGPVDVRIAKAKIIVDNRTRVENIVSSGFSVEDVPS